MWLKLTIGLNPEVHAGTISVISEIVRIARPNLRALIGTGRHGAQWPHVERGRQPQDLRHGPAWGT